jgi:hypothetical protein
MSSPELFHVPARSPPSPERIPVPFTCAFPENWAPLDTTPGTDYELVALSPECLEHHLVAAEVLRSLPGRAVHDVYRVQNPYLWHKFHRYVFSGISDMKTITLHNPISGSLSLVQALKVSLII